jgi:hypothetical protein
VVDEGHPRARLERGGGLPLHALDVLVPGGRVVRIARERIDLDARDALMRSDPETFYITDHYAAYPWVLVRLPRVERAMLATLLEEAFRTVVPKRFLQGAAGGAPRGGGTVGISGC